MKQQLELEPPDMTLREARAVLYRRNDFPEDGGAGERRWSPLASVKFKAKLPNFEWRRRALPLHDLHHVITGYELSPQGEFQMAAWELAAGRYPSAMSTAFCLPLVCMGVVVAPRKTFAAFVRGRRSRTLYFATDIDALLDGKLRDIRRKLLPEERSRATGLDCCAFVSVVAASAFVLAAPFLIVYAGWFFWR